jgi:hypothetical protein
MQGPLPRSADPVSTKIVAPNLGSALRNHKKALRLRRGDVKEISALVNRVGSNRVAHLERKPGRRSGRGVSVDN